MIYLLFFPIIMLLLFVVVALTVAVVLDFVDSRRRKRDLFYQLARDHDRVKRPAAK
jgi:hypothetical protein